MRLPRPADFSTECERFDLRFCCEDCAHFDPKGDRCVHGWPDAEHRRAFYRATADEIVYCKEFELI